MGRDLFVVRDCLITFVLPCAVNSLFEYDLIYLHVMGFLKCWCASVHEHSKLPFKENIKLVPNELHLYTCMYTQYGCGSVAIYLSAVQ